nr:DUF4822 domain-containing protein [Nocardia donostiensis]
MKKVAHAIMALAAVGLLGACGNDDHSSSSNTAPSPPTATSPAVAQGSPSAVLSTMPWETTSAMDSQGASMPLTGPEVSNYVGFAYFKPDGTFTMFNLDDSPKMHDDRSVTPDGATRNTVAKTMRESNSSVAT